MQITENKFSKWNTTKLRKCVLLNFNWQDPLNKRNAIMLCFFVFTNAKGAAGQKYCRRLCITVRSGVLCNLCVLSLVQWRGLFSTERRRHNMLQKSFIRTSEWQPRKGCELQLSRSAPWTALRYVDVQFFICEITIRKQLMEAGVSLPVPRSTHSSEVKPSCTRHSEKDCTQGHQFSRKLFIEWIKEKAKDQRGCSKSHSPGRSYCIWKLMEMFTGLLRGELHLPVASEEGGLAPPSCLWKLHLNICNSAGAACGRSCSQAPDWKVLS